MKNYLKPISMTFMATVLCVSSAQAGIFDGFKSGGSRIGNILRPGNKNPQNPINNPTPPSKDYGVNIPASPQINQAVNRLLMSSSLVIGRQSIDLKKLREIYSARSGSSKNTSIWINQNGLSSMGIALWEYFSIQAPWNGLDTRFYLSDDVVALANDMKNFSGTNQNPDKLAELEILLTQMYWTFIKDLSSGRTNPANASQDLKDIELRKNAPASAKEIADSVISTDALFIGAKTMAPQNSSYEDLVEAMAKLIDAQKSGGWSSLTSLETIRPGATHPNIPAIRQRLSSLGFLPIDANLTSSKYDAEVLEAIKDFQRSNFLEADGIIGPGSYRILNRTLTDVQNQVAANLEKWRFFPKNRPEKYLLVDLGRQELDAIEKDQSVLRLKTVVGGELTGTPSMSDRIGSFILAPYWTAPHSITVKETIPKMLASGILPSKYFAKSGVQVVAGERVVSDVEVDSMNWGKYTMQSPPPYFLRQKRGEGNALGYVKFELNNAHSIYLHDTSSREKFNELERYFSHGCIRVEHPFVLAEYLQYPDKVKLELSQISLVKDEKSRAAAMENYLEMTDGYYTANAQQLALTAQGAKAEATKLQAPVPVVIMGTTTVTYPKFIELSNGQVIRTTMTGLGRDIYKQDARIINALKNSSPNIKP